MERLLGQKAKPVIEITLDDSQQTSFVPSYTTLDDIKGTVSITALTDTVFQDVFILLEGTTKTYVEKVATSAPTNSRSQAYHSFLRLVQPVNLAAYPPDCKLQAGKTYQFPFNFKIPERLLPQTCTHVKDSDHLHNAHLCLPPSLGDQTMASDGRSLRDDFAPQMSTIGYNIKAKIVDVRKDRGRTVILAESMKKIRMIPAVEEHPPLNVEGGKNADYTLRKEKDIKKGLFQGKLGRLTIESNQPQGLRIPWIRSESECPVSTLATIKIRFDPAEECIQPPRLAQLVSKLKVATFYASAPFQSAPSQANIFQYDSQQGLYVDHVTLSSRCVASVEWRSHDPDHLDRHDSVISTLSVDPSELPGPSEAYAGKKFYTTSIVVPVSLPKNKVWLPTFQSCLVSRIYCLDLNLSVRTPSPTVPAAFLHLKLPLQISSEGNPDATVTISPEEARAIAAREGASYPYVLEGSPPAPEYTEVAHPGRFARTNTAGLEVHGAPLPTYEASVGRSMSMPILPMG